MSFILLALCALIGVGGFAVRWAAFRACRALRSFRNCAAWLLLAPVITLTACSTMEVASDYDHSAQFSNLHRFTLIERPHPALNNPLVVQRTYDAIRSELTGKGFEYVSDPVQADLAIDFTIGARDRINVNSYPRMGPAGMVWGNQIDVHQYQEGTLAIDVFDLRSRKPVWHGSARKELSDSDTEHSQKLVEGAVTAVLATFPPK